MRRTRILYPIIALLSVVLVIVGVARISAWRARAEYDRVVQEVAQWGLPTTLEELAERHTLPEDAINGRELLLAAYDKIDWSAVNYDYMPIAGNNEIDPAPGEPYPASATDEMRRFLEINEAGIDELRAAIGEPAYGIDVPFNAIPNWLYSTNWPGDYVSLRYASRTLAIASTFAIEEERIDDAIALIDAGLLLAEREMNQPFILSWLVGNAMAGISVWQTMPLLERGQLSIEQAEALDAVLARARQTGDPGYSYWGDFLIEDAYWSSMDIWRLLEMSNAPGTTPSDYLTAAEIWAYLALGRRGPDRLVAAKEIVGSMRDFYEGVDSLDSTNTVEDTRFTPFGLGEFYSDMSGFYPAIGAYYRWTTHVDGFRVLLAARRYADLNGAFPATLDVLVPEFLDELPADPYSGETLRYKVEDGVAAVYSVGENGVDDGGYDPVDQSRHGDDLCVWIRIPPQILHSE